jgi:hypothetical protein
VSPKDGKGIALVPVTTELDRGLAAPGDYMLVHAKRSGAIDLTVSSSRPNGSVEAEVRLERLMPDASRTTTHVVAAHAPVAKIKKTTSLIEKSPALEILAHVSHRGDILVNGSDWICGPDCPMPIEGLEIRWPGKPADVNLAYEVAAGMRTRQRSAEKLVGQFAGTRGEALPLVGVKLRLTGARASEYELVADALFLGSQIATRSGAEIFLSGSTGREPLVGLRLSVFTRRDAVKSARTPLAHQTIAMKQVGQVRVYRPTHLSAS